MQSCKVQLTKGQATAHLCFKDFNRLRWAIAAMQSNQDLCRSLTKITNGPAYLIDSTILLSTVPICLPEQTHVVLWDGLNSLIELWQAWPNLKYRDDLTYLYVGHFIEVTSLFPKGSMPLFSNAATASISARIDPTTFTPLWFDIASQTRSYLRPMKNWLSAPIRHGLLQRGGQIVFCGVIRPDRSVLDSFFRGTTLEGLRQALSTLEGLEWQGSITTVRTAVQHAYASLQEVQATTPTSWACLYSVLNVIHRLGTLAQVNSRTRHLFINEYGRQTHFDPYNAQAYNNNIFVDFGSTRGPDAVYPRSLDILLNNKPYHCLRLFNSDNSLSAYFSTTSADNFWHTCEKHAHELVERLETMSWLVDRQIK